MPYLTIIIHVGYSDRFYINNHNRTRLMHNPARNNEGGLPDSSMGFSDLLKGGISSKSEDDYRDVTDADVSASNTGSGPQIKSAEVSSQNDVVPVKDAIYEGNIVIIDLAGLSPGSRRWERIEDELVQLTEEVGGDIALNNDTQCIIAPAGIGIDRDGM